MSETVVTCIVKKQEGEKSFGFGIRQPQGQSFLCIKNVADSSPGSRSGLRLDDTLVEIDGTPCDGKSVKDVAQLIAGATDGCLTIKVSRKGRAPSDSNKENEPTTSIAVRSTAQQPEHHSDADSDQPTPIFIHHLRKWPNYPGFGFSLHQKPDGFKYVIRIEQNTPAFASGIQADSVLCQINGHNVRTLGYPDTVKLIKASGSEVTITITSKETLQWLANKRQSLEESMSRLQVLSQDPPPEPPAVQTPAEPAPEPTKLVAPVVAAVVNDEVTAPRVSAPQVEESLRVLPRKDSSSSSSSSSSSHSENAQVVAFRLFKCHVVRPPGVKSYGFGLKFEVEKNGHPGHLVFTKVDPNSPANQAGIEVGNVVVAINGKFVVNTTLEHAKPLIGAGGNEVEFLVADIETLANAVRRFGIDIESAANQFVIANKMQQSVAESPMPERVAWPSDLPPPRNCRLSKWPTKFKGYGFHLQAEKGKPGHYVGKLDPTSPAAHGGLVLNWRIVAVNDENILNEPHNVVVQKIQASGDAVCMLIASVEAVSFCENNRIVLSSTMKECNVKSFQTPQSPPVDSPSPSFNAASPTQNKSSSSDQNQSPAPPTPPSPLPISPHHEPQDDALKQSIRDIRQTIGMRRLKDPRREGNRDVRQAFDLANNL